MFSYYGLINYKFKLNRLFSDSFKFIIYLFITDTLHLICYHLNLSIFFTNSFTLLIVVTNLITSSSLDILCSPILIILLIYSIFYFPLEFLHHIILIKSQNLSQLLTFNVESTSFLLSSFWLWAFIIYNWDILSNFKLKAENGIRMDPIMNIDISIIPPISPHKSNKL